MKGAVRSSRRPYAAGVIVVVIRCVPAIICHVDTPAESKHIIDDNNLLVMGCAERVGTIQTKLEPLARNPIEHVSGRRTAHQHPQHSQVPLQHPYAKLRPTIDEGRKERAQLLGQIRSRGVWIKLDTGIEFPADEYD